MQLNDLKNKRVAVWGVGKEGRALIDFLNRRQLPHKLYAYNDTPPENFETSSAKLFCGDELDNLLDKAEIIVRSPGVSIYKPGMVKARQKGLKITSSSDLFIGEIRANRPECTIIGITGSKGKSTTSSLMYTALKACGRDVALGGNIGLPLIELLEEKHEFMVAELSSYQCSDLSVSPQIVLFTNLFPEHIDWHLNHENYYRDKVHLIAHQQPEDVCFVNAKCEKLRRYCQEYQNHFNYYNTVDGFAGTGGRLCDHGKEIMEIEEAKLEGYHNLDNMAGVLSVIRYLGLDENRALQSFKTFEALPHRLQKIGAKQGVAFFNDSISTAPETAMAAIGSFDKDMGLILGGYDRQQDYRELAEFINHNPKVKAVVTQFQTGPRVAQELKKYVIRKDFALLEADNFSEAVRKLWLEMQKYPDSMLLLSPAAPSYDAYKSFEARGDDFMRIFDSL